jgi:hypothetical protein
MQDCRAMAQAVSGWPPSAEGRVRSCVSQCGTCGGQSVTGTDFFLVLRVYPNHLHHRVAQ